jgi:acyl-coenzyme A thioesterase PaaI-like protein
LLTLQENGASSISAPPKHRGAIVRAAVTLFRRNGYAATGINEIAKVSGAPKASLYHYFPGGKDEIAEAAVRLAGAGLVATTLLESAPQSAVMAAAGREAFASWCAAIARALIRDGFGKAETAPCRSRPHWSRHRRGSARWSKENSEWSNAMEQAPTGLDRGELESFVTALAFVREYGIEISSAAPGAVTIEMPFDARFSGPPGQFPASTVGTAGDVAAVLSCLSLLPRGWAAATLDFTIKMTGVAKGDKLRAKGRVLQAGRTNSVGAADIYAVSNDDEVLCGSVLATTRNFQIK